MYVCIGNLSGQAEQDQHHQLPVDQTRNLIYLHLANSMKRPFWKPREGKNKPKTGALFAFNVA